MGRGAGKHQGPAGRNDAVVTLEEALEETEPRATVFWGDGLRALARRTSRHVAVRWIHSDEAEEIEGLTTEWSLTPTRGEETRLVCTMPRSREELLWRLQMAAYMLPSGGEVWVAGHRREGIKSAAKPLESLVGAVTTRRTKRHCRVLVAMLDAPALSPPTMEDHEKRFGWDPPTGEPLQLATVPGTFAHGRLDHGAAAMLEVIPQLEAPTQTLDLGAGSGVLGGAIAGLFPTTRVDLVDYSASACASIERMVALNSLSPERVKVFLTSVESAPKGPYDLVVTNPPFHEGRHQNRTLVDRFAESARRRLTPWGTLLLVANRHLGYAENLRAVFKDVDVAFEDTRFRVWRARSVRR